MLSGRQGSPGSAVDVTVTFGDRSAVLEGAFTTLTANAAITALNVTTASPAGTTCLIHVPGIEIVCCLFEVVFCRSGSIYILAGRRCSSLSWLLWSFIRRSFMTITLILPTPLATWAKDVAGLTLLTHFYTLIAEVCLSGQ